MYNYLWAISAIVKVFSSFSWLLVPLLGEKPKESSARMRIWA